MKNREQEFEAFLTECATILPRKKEERRAEYCRRLYNLGLVKDAPKMPEKGTERRQVTDKHKPRAAVLYDYLTQRFAVIGFGWSAFTMTDRDRFKHGVKFRNYPKLSGRELSIFELLIIPVGLIDQMAKQVDGGWEMDAPPAPKSAGGHAFDHRSGLLANGTTAPDYSPCSPPAAITPVKRDPAQATGWDIHGD